VRVCAHALIAPFAQMEPVNRPTQLRLKAAEKALGFPTAQTRDFAPTIIADGVANAVVFWFELQMEKSAPLPCENTCSVRSISPVPQLMVSYA
jgi:hypothetical protein